MAFAAPLYIQTANLESQCRGCKQRFGLFRNYGAVIHLTLDARILNPQPPLADQSSVVHPRYATGLLVRNWGMAPLAYIMTSLGVQGLRFRVY